MKAIIVSSSVLGSSAKSSSGGGSILSNHSANQSAETIKNMSTCISNYACLEWEQCSNNFQKRVCNDTVCGKEEKIERRPCSNTCPSNYACLEWEQCNYMGKTEDIMKGELKFSGIQHRTCTDTNKCVKSYIEDKECNEIEKVNFALNNECGNEVLVAMSSQSNEPVTKIDLESWKSRRLDISFVQGKSLYCSSCFNGVKDANEEGVDCGGQCKKCEQENTNASNYFEIASWTLFGILLLGFIAMLPIFKVYKIRRLIRLGEKAVNKNNLTKARKIYRKMRGLYYELSKKRRLSIEKDIYNYYLKVKY